MSPSRRLGDDAGSAVVDFTLTSVLLLLVFLAVFQVGLALHVRNTLISCASEGARYGARQGSDPQQGAQRARGLIAQTLSDHYARDVSTRTGTTEAGVQVLVVEVSAPLPVLGPLGPDGALTVRGRAFVEGQ